MSLNTMNQNQAMDTEKAPKKPLSYKTVSNNRKRTRGRVNYTQTINYDYLGQPMTKVIHHRYIK